MRIAARLGDVAARLGRTTAQVAIAWALAQRGVAAALKGPSSLQHLTENAGACGWPLPENEIAEINELLLAEETLVEEAGLVSAKRILAGPLPADTQEACRDLMYVLEMAVERGWATTADVTPLALALLKAIKDPLSSYSTEEVAAKLRTLIWERLARQSLLVLADKVVLG